SASPTDPTPTPTAPRPSATRTTAPARPAAPALRGVGAADREAWAAWLGRPVQIDETWNDAKDASGNVTWDKMDGVYSTWANFGNGKWPGALSIGQPMF